jgi:hypothetical protein
VIPLGVVKPSSAARRRILSFKISGKYIHDHNLLVICKPSNSVFSMTQLDGRPTVHSFLLTLQTDKKPELDSMASAKLKHAKLELTGRHRHDGVDPTRVHPTQHEFTHLELTRRHRHDGVDPTRVHPTRVESTPSIRWRRPDSSTPISSRTESMALHEYA